MNEITHDKGVLLKEPNKNYKHLPLKTHINIYTQVCKGMYRCSLTPLSNIVKDLFKVSMRVVRNSKH